MIAEQKNNRKILSDFTIFVLVYIEGNMTCRQLNPFAS